MIKKLLSKYGYKLAAVALLIGQLSAYMPCRSEFYQPEIPKELLK